MTRYYITYLNLRNGSYDTLGPYKQHWRVDKMAMKAFNSEEGCDTIVLKIIASDGKIKVIKYVNTVLAQAWAKFKTDFLEKISTVQSSDELTKAGRQYLKSELLEAAFSKSMKPKRVGPRPL